MFTHHVPVLTYRRRPKIGYPFSMKIYGRNKCIRRKNITHSRTEFSGTRNYSGSSSIPVSKISDCIQPIHGRCSRARSINPSPDCSPDEFSIQFGERERK
jgi:hypothetical protein